jgi:hypothetical protein
LRGLIVALTVAIVLIVVLVIVIFVLLGRNRSGSVRGEEYRRMAKERSRLAGENTGFVGTLDAIELLCDRYTDIESPLASEIRQAIRTDRANRRAAEEGTDKTA